jgi:hypothetical protein
MVVSKVWIGSNAGHYDLLSKRELLALKDLKLGVGRSLKDEDNSGAHLKPAYCVTFLKQNTVFRFDLSGGILLELEFLWSTTG